MIVPLAHVKMVEPALMELIATHVPVQLDMKEPIVRQVSV